jgi:hypothetical protein
MGRSMIHRVTRMFAPVSAVTRKTSASADSGPQPYLIGKALTHEQDRPPSRPAVKAGTGVVLGLVGSR